MNKEIFHIGYHKTGTTWFQNNYYPNLKNIEFINRNKLQNYFLTAHPNEFDSYECRKAFKSSKNIVFCDEELSGNIHSGGLHGCMTKEVSFRIKESFPDATIIIFIRNQVDMIASVYAQYIKKGGTYSIDNYLYHKDNYNHRFPLFEFEHFNYYKFIKHYIELFGRDKVKIFMYEDFLSNNYDFISMYSESLSLDYNISKLKRDKSNVAYKKSVLKLAKFLNIFTKYDVVNKYYLIHIPGFYQAAQRFLNKINNFLSFEKKYTSEEMLGKNNLDFIHNYYVESNSKLLNEFDIDIKKFNYPLKVEE